MQDQGRKEPLPYFVIFSSQIAFLQRWCVLGFPVGQLPEQVRHKTVVVQQLSVVGR